VGLLPLVPVGLLLLLVLAGLLPLVPVGLLLPLQPPL
jgi:hypothetical protein